MGLFSHQGLLGNSQLRGRTMQIGVCFAASSGFFLLGYDQGVMSGILTEPIFLGLFPKMNPDYKSGAIQALVVAVYEIGCLMGALGIVGFGDKLGRRRAILVGACIMLVGAAIQTSAFSLSQLIVGRIVTGWGNGMNTSTIPVWQSEVAPPKIRGFLVLFEGALITAGIVLSYWLNYGFWFITDMGSFQWRFPIAFQCVFAVVLIIGVLLFPESPRWLLKHGHREDAIDLMARFHDTTPDDEQVLADIKEIDELNAVTQGRALSWKEFLGNGREMNLWRTSVACGSQCLQQISGINLVTYYATTVFEDSLGFDPALSRFMTGWLGMEYFFAACAALFVVDRYGRRNLMMFGAAGMGICTMIMGVGLSQVTEKNLAGAYAATVAIFIYNTCFAIGWLGIGWLYPAEVTPIRIRAEANGLSTATNWIWNYVVVQLSPIMINTISWKTYFVFMCINFAIVPTVYFFFPETNAHKLERLDAIFAEAHDKRENPVFTERRLRKQGGILNVEREANINGAGDNYNSEKEEEKDAGNNGTSHEYKEEI